MADGSVKIDVGLNLAKAEKDLEKLKAKIAKAEDQLNANASKKTALEEQIRTVGAQADEATRKVQELKDALGQTSNRGEKATIRAQLAEATEEQRILTRESNRLNDEYVKVNQKIEQGTTDLTEMKDQAGELVREINTARPGEALAAGFEKARKSFVKFLKYAIGIRSVYVLFRRLRSAIADAVKQYAEYNYQTKFALAELKATKSAISAAFGSWIANALPYVQKIANWMLEAANAASKFVAILSGRSTYKKAVIDQNEIAASLAETADEEEEVAEEAKEAKKQLMGFDELNILSDDSSADKKDKDKKDKIDKTELDGFKLVEEAIDAFDGSFLNNLALSFKDVLFEWKDLNPEQIAKKIIAGLGAVLGAALGISLGMGPGGVILLALGGLTFGLIFDALVFDNDGQLSESEIQDMLLLALNSLVGGVAGLIFAPPGAKFKGAMIGASVAAALTTAFIGYDFKTEGEKSGILSKITDALNYAIGGAAGAKLGFVLGGPGGAAIGLVLGLGITFLIDNIVNGKNKLEEIDEYLKNVFAKDWEEIFGPVLTPIVNTFFDFLSTVWDNIYLLFSGLVDFIKGVFTGDWELALNGVTDVFYAAINLMVGWLPWLLDQIKEWFTSITDYLTNDFGKAIEDFFGPIIGGHLNDCLDNILGWWADVKQVFDGVIDFIVGVFTGNWERAWLGVREIFEGIFSTLADILKAPINGIIRLVNKAIGALNVLIDGANKIPKVSIPRLAEIPYLAHGGILKRGQVGLLEGSGAEAVVPLEKNTGWTNVIADGLMDRLTQANFASQLASAFASTPLPAMAGGGIVPPNAVQGGGFGNESMAQAVRQGVYDAIMALGGMPKGGGTWVMNVDSIELARATYNARQTIDSQHGMSLIGAYRG